MTVFVKLTKSGDGNMVFVNIDEVRSMCRVVGENAYTTLTFDKGTATT